MTAISLEHSAALREFPDLQRLIDLCDASWSFQPVVDATGELIEVRGVREWPGGWADAVRVRYATDARAVRIDGRSGITWQRDGTLDEVVDGLIALPFPSDRHAPRLVFSHAAKR